MHRVSKAERAFNVVNIIFMIFTMFIMIYPLLYVLCASLSDPDKLIAHSGILLSPLGFNTEAYKAVFQYDIVWSGYSNTLFIIIVGVSINLILTTIGAYALSQRDFMWKKCLMLFIVFTMLFNGGLIPFYLTVKGLGINNTLWSLIVPGAISTFNLIILRTTFEGVPVSISEAARIDGAGHLELIVKILLPVCLPTLAVLALYYTVGHWNAWFYASIFIRDRYKFPLQLVLMEVLIGNETTGISATADVGERQTLGETIKYAIIIVSTLPIMLIYPFLQKYFVKGALVGAVKE